MKNGFTLVELLAVIVILGLIALITITSMENTINSSKNKLSELVSLGGITDFKMLVKSRKRGN